MFFLPNLIKYPFSALVLLISTIPTVGYLPVYLAWWLLGTPMFVGFIFSFIRTYYYGYIVQTKQDLLCSLCGLSLTSFCWNLTEMLHSNAIIDLSIWWQIFFSFGQWYYYWQMCGTPVKMFFKPGKVIINRCHLSLIILFFLITAQLISPYAESYNWACHLLIFWLTIETSLVFCSREFELDKLCDEEDYDKYLGTLHTW